MAKIRKQIYILSGFQVTEGHFRREVTLTFDNDLEAMMKMNSWADFLICDTFNLSEPQYNYNELLEKHGWSMERTDRKITIITDKNDPNNNIARYFIDDDIVEIEIE